MLFFAFDPYYRDPSRRAGWVRRETERYGVRVHVRDDLDSPGYCSPDGRTVLVRPALAFPALHWILSCSVVASVFGFEAAAEDAQADSISPVPTTLLTSRSSNIIPFRHPGKAFGSCRV
jgi:hypothetical protein